MGEDENRMVLMNNYSIGVDIMKFEIEVYGRGRVLANSATGISILRLLEVKKIRGFGVGLTP